MYGKKMSDKQKRQMDKLGLDYDDAMTYNEAKYLISEELEMLSELDDANYNPFLDDSDVPLFDYSTNSQDEY